ncbi:MAG: methyltransferase [Candidatus Kapaibacterium sp.]|nr:MAG: methyltransferase [Candidatus Kapabacteria bacterium]
MRVISGRWGGRLLPARVPPETRPTLDAVREAIFNMLASRLAFQGQRVLDLYAGSGALGIEALSRGAAHVTFVERSQRAAAAIEQNCRALGIAQDEYIIVRGDTTRFLERAAEHVTLVFADPPYRSIAEWGRLLPALATARCVERDAVIVLEHVGGLSLALPPSLVLLEQRRWGDTGCTIAVRQ